MSKATLIVQIEDSGTSPRKVAEHARNQGLTAEVTPMGSTRDLVTMTGNRTELEQILALLKNKVGYTEWKSLPIETTSRPSVKSLRAKYASKAILVDYDGDDVPYIREQNSQWWATARLTKDSVYRIDGRDAQKLADELVRRGGRIIR